jgi:hypothetical protein
MGRHRTAMKTATSVRPSGDTLFGHASATPRGWCNPLGARLTPSRAGPEYGGRASARVALVAINPGAETGGAA